MGDEDKTKAQQAEDEIRKQAALIDLAHDAIIVRDLDSRVVSWSRGAEATYGFTAEHALGQVTHELLRTQFPTTLEDVDQSLTQYGQWSGELVHTRAEGKAIVVSSRQALQRNDRGEPVAILEINRDITERKRAEEELAKLNTELEQRVKERTADLQKTVARLEEEITQRKRMEEKLRFRGEQFETLLNEAPLGVYLVDADFRIAQVNPIALPVFGDIPDLIGRDFDEVIHILWEKGYADEIARIFRHTLQTGEPYETPESAEFRADREVVEYYEWRVNRITLPDGRYGVVAYFRDISERKQAEHALRQSEEMFRLLVDGVKDYAIFMLDAAGRVVSWNEGAQRIKGWTAEEIIGQHFSRFYPADSAAGRHPQQELDIAAAQGRFEEEGWRVRKDGSSFWASVIITALRDEQGRLRGFAKVTRDITEQKHQEVERQKLLDEQQALTEELATANEELQVHGEELLVQAEELSIQRMSWRG
ncbi:MAG: PAS domain-containing protein [Desulfobaccales bacterium]